MKVNLEAYLLVPNGLLRAGRTDPPIAEFKGRHNLTLATSEDVAMFLKHKYRFCGCTFNIIAYDEKRNTLVIRGDVPFERFLLIDGFLKEKIAQHPRWKIIEGILALCRENIP